MLYSLLNMLLNLYCQYFVEDFCVNIHQGLWLVCSFLIVSLSVFGIRIMVALQGEFRSVSFSIFQKSLRRIGVYSLYVWQNSPVKLFQNWAFICWEAFYYRFSLLTSYRSIHIYYSFTHDSSLSTLWCFQEFINFIQMI